MERHSHEDLRAIADKLTVMGQLVESRVRQAITALLQRQADLAVQVASGDAAVNDLELEVDDLCIKFLALQSPVASDLRLVRSIIKVNTDLERVGDQAVNIAQSVIRLLASPPLRPTIDIALLGETAVDMLHDSLTAFVTQDATRAQSVLVRDDQADALRDSVFRVLLTHMMADPGVIERALGLILVSRSLERIADHATNIAEELIFVVEGRVIRHSGGALAGLSQPTAGPGPASEA
jgi:phosphate transport system protein